MKEPALGNRPESSSSVIPATAITAKPVSSLRLLNLNEGREAILHYFENTWRLTETLFSALTCEEA